MLTTELFIPINSNLSDLYREIQKPILKNQFDVENKEVLLMLTENYLVLCENTYSQIPTHFCKLLYSVKSEAVFQTMSNLGNQSQFNLQCPLGIIFQRQQCSQKIAFYSQHFDILKLWLVELEKKINQRNFHRLFKAKKKIGKGAFATVYLAQRLRDRKMVAVKAFSKQKQYASEKGKESLENQINLMRNINHSNIMRIEGVYETQNSIYVILEYLQGVQLNEVLKNSKVIGNDNKCEIIKNLLKGLQCLSDKRIIHRDLKPDNIMFRDQDSTDAVICDFGLATFADAQEYLFVRCGTPGFVSPQIINMKDVTAKSDSISDMFSAGLIFHYLLFGHSVFPGKKYNQVLSQNRACQFDLNQPKYQQISPLALDLMVRMLQKDPSKRISAQKALAHSYFSSDAQMMDIQEPEKRSPFQELSHNFYMASIKSGDNIQAPSDASSRKSDINFSVKSRQQQNQGIF